ncbi:MAG: CoA-binding protein [Desulfobulbaceae bacterium]|nr:CoA-binding protein [Desulfobulbaceae bacterium]MCK5404363.1 CoA-binding protein [Desulfobulbaceae bacterium]
MLISVPEIVSILTSCKTIAVVGLSPKPERPSNQVAVYLEKAGYTIIPVNPGQDMILGHRSYPDLQSVPVKIDMVDIFRRPQDVLPIVHDSIAIGAKVVWMQEGVVNEEAAAVARAAGLTVIMDRCVKRDHEQFLP